MRKKAFTLIELLVVIAILSLLLAVVLPAMRSAKEQAKQVYCKNNLKQLAMAAHTYNFDQDDYYPIARFTRQTVVTASATSDVSSVTEDSVESGSTVVYQNTWDFTRVSVDGNDEIIPGTLWQGDTVVKVQHCPSYKGSDNWTGVPYTGYNYNTSHIGHGQGELVSARYTGQTRLSADGLYTVVLPVKAAQVKSPGNGAWVGDGHYASGANKFMRSPFYWDGDYDTSLRAAGTQGFRHRGQTNVAWCDGHVGAQSEYYTESSTMVKMQLDEYNQNNNIKIGFISPDNSRYDLK
ncbi:MAG: DUF1559 family PulG-like putative transporter [Planctomycetota bacterium]|jgi:prepilin-type N-terminal cleavage/methylation domain-containing protein/prepilin-type processing-associated H-X9-DG protein